MRGQTAAAASAPPASASDSRHWPGTDSEPTAATASNITPHPRTDLSRPGAGRWRCPSLTLIPRLLGVDDFDGGCVAAITPEL